MRPTSAHPLPQPTAARGGDMRAQLLVAATRLFAERGFDGTALQDIADAVGIRKPSLLHHFASKDDLRLAVLDDLLSRWKDILPALLMAATNAGRRFDAVFETVVAFFVEDPARARLLVREVLDRPAAMKTLIREHLRPWLGMIADYIRQGQREGIIHADVDADAYIAQMLHFIMASIAMQDTLGVVLTRGESPRAGMERATRELTRLARAALFLPRTPTRGRSRSRSAAARTLDRTPTFR